MFISLKAISQTEWITCYTICSDVTSRIDFTINLVDTPGFGDTRGLDQDEKIVSQISRFLKAKDSVGVAKIDLVCFVLKAPDNRLTASLKYIFESVLAIFGKDMKNNICSLITFCDGQTPQVLSAIHALERTPLPFEKYFEFNNSALFSSNIVDDQSLSQFYWNMGLRTCEQFFEYLKKMKPTDLRLTNDLLEIRSLHNDLSLFIQKRVIEYATSVCLLEEQMQQFQHINRENSFNNDFEVKENKDVIHKEDINGKGIHTTTCLNCNITCHENCPYAIDSLKYKCIVMDNSGNCKLCPGKCSWQSHSNVPYIIKRISKSVHITNQEMKSRYRITNENKRLLLLKIKQTITDQTSLENFISDKITLLKTNNAKIKEIGLRPQTFSSVEYIQMIIESEKSEKRRGFNHRIEKLQQYMKRADIENTFCKLKDRCHKVRQMLQA